MERELRTWMRAAADSLVKREVARLRRKGLAGAVRKNRTVDLTKKDKLDPKLLKRLETILRVWGLRQAKDTARRVGVETDEEVILPPSFEADLIRRARHQANRIYHQTSEAATESVNNIVRSALRAVGEPRSRESAERSVDREIAAARARGQSVGDTERERRIRQLTHPRTPSVGEVARRIRSQMHGQAGGSIEDVREQRTIPGTSLRYRLDDERFPARGQGRMLYALSSERAATIARTEIGRAQSIAQDAAYQAVGVWGYEWLAIRDGRSGRGHGLMHGQVVKRGQKFRFPDGNKCSYPRSMDCPKEHAINCRCDFKPLLKKPPGWKR
jgi:hypothetical protein